MIARLEALCPLAGRIILGLYFILPGGLMKIFNYQGTADYMAEHGMVMIPFFLILTIVIQLGAGAALIAGYKAQIAAFLLAGLTLVISLVMHNFWDVADALQRAHETQNFVKNLGIIAGLLVLSGLGAGRFSVDQRKG
ncbi:MAG: DoxX family protein [Gammaproteobacteria bacterium]|nr:DoxX family protein [Gammaproteobacteria bacterium]